MIPLPTSFVRLGACRPTPAMRAFWRAQEGIPARSTPCFRAEDGGGRLKLYVYDVIGGWDLDTAEFVKAVHGAGDSPIDLHVNSPGGLVYDGVAMFEALAAHEPEVAVHVDGLAASAASFLAMAGDTRDISKAGRVVIHDAQVMAWGSPADLREAADLGDAVSDDIAGFYADRAGGERADWRARMQATTWYSAAEAVSAGLMDSVRSSASDDDSAAENRARLIRARHRAMITARG